MSQKPAVLFQRIVIRPMHRDDFRSILKIEPKIYRKNDRLGPALITHIKQKNGLGYSEVVYGKRTKNSKVELIGYLVAIDDKMDDGRKCVYLDDIALLPEVQRQGIGWKLLRVLVKQLHGRAVKSKKRILFDMHLMKTSLAFMEKNSKKLAKLGCTVVSDYFYKDYYKLGKDAIYRVYQVK